MGDQCQHLDGRVVIRGRDGAPEQLRRGLLGVGVFVAGVAVAFAVVVATVVVPLLYASQPTWIAGLETLSLTDPVGAARVLAPLAPLAVVYVVGALGFLVSWRRSYDVTVEVREGLLRWD